MNWAEVAGRVIVEAVAADPRDVLLLIGDGAASDAIAQALAARVGRLVRGDSLGAAPAGLSVVCLHQTLRLRPPEAQRALFAEAARVLPPRGLLVIGDVMWSLPFDQIDAPEQFGDRLAHVQTTATVEGWARKAGFLPDMHRFGAGVGVLIAVRA